MKSQNQIFVAILALFFDCRAAFMIFPFYSPPGVEFYEDVDFKGLIWQGPTTPYDYQQNCTLLPEWGKAKTSSMKVTSCIIAFSDDSCQATANNPSYSFFPGNYSNVLEVKHHSQNADNSIRSFRACTADECTYGNGVHITLYKNKENEEKLVEYFNFYQCTNLPSYTAKNVEALDNFGNCVALYDSADCTGKSVEIRGGVSKESLNLKHVDFAGNAVSIGLCANVTACNAPYFPYPLEYAETPSLIKTII